MSESKYPAAFINTIADSGSKEEAIDWLQRTHEDNMRLRAVLKEIGDEHPGSSLQEWCYNEAGFSLESRSVQRRIAIQKGEQIPLFDVGDEGDNHS